MGPNPSQPVAQIVITMLADGRIGGQANVPNRQTFNMMMETARQDMLKMMVEKEAEQAKGGGIEVPNGQLKNALLKG